MNFPQLEALFAVAKLGSINKAAEALYISQPALKKRLDTLESELGISLFVREKTGCSLTPAGRILCDELPPLYGQMLNVIHRAQADGIPMKLRISQVPMLTLHYCDMLIGDFQRAHPEIAIERVFMNNDLWLESLAGGKIELCLVPGTDAAARSWTKEGFLPVYDGEGSLTAILSPNHPLAQKQTLTLADLRPWPVYSEPIMLRHGGLAEAAEKAGVKVTMNEKAFNRYSMIDSASQGCIYLHCSDLAPDIASLMAIPVSDFAYHNYILLRTAKEPALSIFRDFLLSGEKKREILRADFSGSTTASPG